MKLVDKRGKAFGIINIIDLTVIVVIVIAVIAGAVYYTVSGKVTGEGHKITYEIEMQRQTKTFADNVEVGDDVVEVERNVAIGKIISKSVKPATQVNPDLEQGKYVKSTIPEAYDVVITVEAQAVISEKSIAINTFEIITGLELGVKGKGFISNAIILGIKTE